MLCSKTVKSEEGALLLKYRLAFFFSRISPQAEQLKCGIRVHQLCRDGLVLKTKVQMEPGVRAGCRDQPGFHHLGIA